MLETLDRTSRDSTLFQFTSKRLRDFIDPNHLLIRIAEQLTLPSWWRPWKIVTALTSAVRPSTPR